MKELILDRNPMVVSHVVKPSLSTFTSEFIKELTLERIPIDVSNVGTLSLVLLTLGFMKEKHWRKSLWM
jgi:hypothetical protein